jgi:hypothetical protein
LSLPAPFGASLQGAVAGKDFQMFALNGQNGFMALRICFVLMSSAMKNDERSTKKPIVNLYDVTRLKYP